MKMMNGSYKQIRIMFRKLHSSAPRVCTNNHRKMHGKPMHRYASLVRAKRNNKKNMKFWEWIGNKYEKKED